MRRGNVSASVSWWEERKRGEYVTKQERKEMETVHMTINSFTHPMIHRVGLWYVIASEDAYGHQQIVVCVSENRNTS